MILYKLTLNNDKTVTRTKVFEYKVDIDCMGFSSGLVVRNGIVYLGRNYQTYNPSNPKLKYPYLPQTITIGNGSTKYGKLIDVLRLKDGVKLGTLAIKSSSVIHELEGIDITDDNKLILYDNNKGKNEYLYSISLNKHSLTRIKIKANNVVAGKNDLTAKVYDSKGKEVATVSTTIYGNLNVKDLEAGTYTMKIVKTTSKYSEYKGKEYEFKVDKKLIKQMDTLNSGEDTLELQQYTT
jgi:hypothetical protein